MIERRIELISGAVIAHLSGRLDDRQDATCVADELVRQHHPGDALVVDLSALDVADFEPVSWLVLQLEAWLGWRDVRLVDTRLAAARQLRATAHRLPVLPDVTTALTLPVLDASPGSGKMFV